MHNIYSFADALKVIENILEQKRAERDEFGPQPDTNGLYVSWDAYQRRQEEVEVLEDVLESLSNESSIQHHIAEYNDREDAS